MLNLDDTGVVLIDIQGKLANLVYESDALINNCVDFVEGAKILGLPIIWLEQNPERLGPTSKKLNKALSNYKPITKYTFNACDTPEFIDAIEFHNKQNWLLCGIESHICVYQTAVGLHEKGVKVQVVNECVSSRTLENKQLALQKLMQKQIEITGIETCLYELVGDCRSPHFKAILQLIK
ncbi:isochorismatase family protein [Glaciecola sp. 1036]|uniref:isochorismatase family protein n=1 Tax=Alteromonadaceae TaxID=72275 RepID=UPI003D067103